MKPWKRIRAFARKNGADVVPFWNPAKLGPGVGFAPFISGDRLGLHWEPRIVYIHEEALQVPLVVGGLIHELGHVLATDRLPIHAVEADFLGWEYLVAKKTDAFEEWSENMREYAFDGGDEWWQLTNKEKNMQIKRHLLMGIVCKNVVCGEPISVRKEE